MALVAATDMETCRRALASIDVAYEVLAPLTDPERAQESPPVHPEGNIVRRVPIERGDPDAEGDIVVEGVYEVGMQDQAFLGPESGLAVPADDGGVDLYVATQGLTRTMCNWRPAWTSGREGQDSPGRRWRRVRWA